MTRDLFLAAWLCVALLFLLAELLAFMTDRAAGFREILQRLVSGNWRLVFVFLGWMWMGWHFFAR
jgi:hypothetical protein